MNPRIWIEFAVAVILFVVGLFWLRDREAANADEWHKALQVAQAKVKVQTIIQHDASVHYDTVEKSWIKYRDRILHDTVQRVTARERDIITHADTLRVACDTLKKADTSLISSVKTEAKIAESPPGKHIQFFGEALYNLIDRQPVARAGVELHIFKALYLTGAEEVSYRNKPRTLVGGRINF